MSDTEEPIISFVCNRDKGDAGGGGRRMYAPKRVAVANGNNNNNKSNSVGNSNSTPPPNGGGYFSRGYVIPQQQIRGPEDMRARLAADSEEEAGEEEVTTNNRNTTDNDDPLRNVLPTPPCLIHPRRRSSPHIDDLDDSWATSSSLKNFGDSNRSSQQQHQQQLFNQLTNQRWHEIGNGEYPLCATNNFDLMVEQLTSVLASRLTELLIYRLNKARRMKQPHGEEYNGGSSSSSSTLEFLKLDMELGNYVLADDVLNSLREYVAEIGRLHNNVGFHSFEHATHVFLSMNKLLSMVTTADDLNVVAKRRLSAQDIASSAFVPSSRRSSTDSGGSSTDCDGHRRRAEHLSFRISEDPAIRFAMVFSALIHDVGEYFLRNVCVAVLQSLCVHLLL